MTAEAHDFLFEIGTEELPAKLAQRLAEQIATNFERELKDVYGLTYSGKPKIYSTPRRLAFHLPQLQAIEPQQEVKRKGPALNQAYDEKGNPTPALAGFLKSCNAMSKDLEQEQTDKGIWLFYKMKKGGRQTITILPEILTKVFKNISTTKMMRFGADNFVFLRPVKWLLALYGSDVISLNLFGLQASNLTYGHHFHHPDAIKIKEAQDYEPKLLKANVIANFTARRQKIVDSLNAVLTPNEMIKWDVLNEVTGLVEWPVPVRCDFNPDFLRVPKEALIASMETHQKCFPILNQKGELQPHFFVIANIDSNKPEVVKHGNEKVMSARLADAAFFYDTDKAVKLESHEAALKKINFQAGLGTVWDKVERLQQLVARLGEASPSYPALRITFSGEERRQLLRAAQLCKMDLVTGMVEEFPELQGIMGAEYACAQGEDAIVADAIRDHYKPVGKEDSLPQSIVGSYVAIIDKMDTIVGIIGIGLKPSASSDPFALRRQALGIVRIIIDKQLPIDLKALIAQAAGVYERAIFEKHNKNVQIDVLQFILERLRFWYQDQNIKTQIINAVFALNLTEPVKINERITALSQFLESGEVTSLLESNKRIGNILGKNTATVLALNENLLQETAEKELFAAYQKIKTKVQNTQGMADYLNALLAFREPLAAFFDHVMVMADDETLRQNRLALLKDIQILFLEVADFTKL